MLASIKCLESLFLGIREMTALFITREILKLAPSGQRSEISDGTESCFSVSTADAVQASRHLLSSVTVKLENFAGTSGHRNRVRGP